MGEGNPDRGNPGKPGRNRAWAGEGEYNDAMGPWSSWGQGKTGASEWQGHCWRAMEGGLPKVKQDAASDPRMTRWHLVQCDLSMSLARMH